MKDTTKGKLFVVSILALISMSLGCVCGMSNIADEASRMILPVSLTQENDKINVIHEEHEKLNEITIENETPTEIKQEINNQTDNQEKINKTKDKNIIDKIMNKNVTIIENKTPNETTNQTTIQTTDDEKQEQTKTKTQKTNQRQANHTPKTEHTNNKSH